MTGLNAVAALGTLAVILSLIMAGAWLVWRQSGNSGWIDMIWTFGLGGLGCGSALLSQTGSERRLIVGSLIVLWSLRLGLHIAHRTTKIVDDPRYAMLAKDWGQDARRQMFWLLQKQALVSIPLAFSMLLAASNPAPGLRAQDIAAILIFAVAIGGEALADEQRALGDVAAALPHARPALQLERLVDGAQVRLVRVLLDAAACAPALVGGAPRRRSAAIARRAWAQRDHPRCAQE